MKILILLAISAGLSLFAQVPAVPPAAPNKPTPTLVVPTIPQELQSKVLVFNNDNIVLQRDTLVLQERTKALDEQKANIEKAKANIQAELTAACGDKFSFSQNPDEKDRTHPVICVAKTAPTTPAAPSAPSKTPTLPANSTKIAPAPGVAPRK